MSLRAARILTGTYLVLMVIFVTWPGMVPFARIRPLILGLPFSFAWVAGWGLGARFVLGAVDRVESRHREDD
jgi:hypothetical protein